MQQSQEVKGEKLMQKVKKYDQRRKIQMVCIDDFVSQDHLSRKIKKQSTGALYMKWAKINTALSTEDSGMTNERKPLSGFSAPPRRGHGLRYT